MNRSKHTPHMDKDKSSLFCYFRPLPFLLTQESWLSSQLASYSMRWMETPSWSKGWNFKVKFIYLSMHSPQTEATSSATALALPACCSPEQRSLGKLFPEICRSIHCNDRRHWLQSLWWEFWRPTMNHKSEQILFISPVTVWSLKNIYWDDSGCGRHLFWERKKLWHKFICFISRPDQPLICSQDSLLLGGLELNSAVALHGPKEF